MTEDEMIQTVRAGIEKAADCAPSHAVTVTEMLESSMGPVEAHQGAAYLLAASATMCRMTREEFLAMMGSYFDAFERREAQIAAKHREDATFAESAS